MSGPCDHGQQVSGYTKCGEFLKQANNCLHFAKGCVLQLKNVECFKYLGIILTNDGRCTCEIKSRIAVGKAAFNKKKTLFTSKLDLNLRKKLGKCYLEHGFVWC